MAMTSRSPEDRLYDYCQPLAAAVKVVLQMLIGVVIIVILALKLFLFIKPQDNKFFQFLASSHPLTITGYALAISACIELAYMLFTPGPDEAIEPVMLGFSSAALIVSARDDLATFQNATILVVLVAGIAVLFRVRRRNFLDSERDRRRTAAEHMLERVRVR
jgi:hypothetical protein